MRTQEFIDELRTALMQLDNIHRLHKSPLLPLLCAQAEDASPVALQRRLLSAIDALKEKPGIGSTRHYDVLYYRFVEQLPQPEAAFQLGMSVRQLRREQHGAIEVLADHLWRRLQQPDSGRAIPDHNKPAENPEELSLQREIAWLSSEFGVESSDVRLELDKALEQAHALIARYTVAVEVTSTVVDGRVTVPPMALRQAFIMMLSILTPHYRALHIVLSEVPSDVSIVLYSRRSDTANRELAASHAASTAVGEGLETASQLLSQFGGRVYSHQSDLLSITVRVPRLVSVPILLIDDNPDVHQLFTRYADGSRYRIVATNEVRHAAELAADNDIQATVLDIMMPEVDGWDLLARWRNHPRTQTIPVAVCSILPQRELSELLGADLFIQKPVSQEAFLRALDRLTT